MSLGVPSCSPSCDQTKGSFCIAGQCTDLNAQTKSLPLPPYGLLKFVDNTGPYYKYAYVYNPEAGGVSGYLTQGVVLVFPSNEVAKSMSVKVEKYTRVNQTPTILQLGPINVSAGSDVSRNGLRVQFDTVPNGINKINGTVPLYLTYFVNNATTQLLVTYNIVTNSGKQYTYFALYNPADDPGKLDANGYPAVTWGKPFTQYYYPSTNAKPDGYPDVPDIPSNQGAPSNLTFQYNSDSKTLKATWTWISGTVPTPVTVTDAKNNVWIVGTDNVSATLINPTPGAIFSTITINKYPISGNTITIPSGPSPGPSPTGTQPPPPSPTGTQPPPPSPPGPPPSPAAKPSVWSKYKWWFIGGIILFAVLILIVIILATSKKTKKPQ